MNVGVKVEGWLLEGYALMQSKRRREQIERRGEEGREDLVKDREKKVSSSYRKLKSLA
jgi:hypothetical protein